MRPFILFIFLNLKLGFGYKHNFVTDILLLKFSFILGGHGWHTIPTKNLFCQTSIEKSDARKVKDLLKFPRSSVLEGSVRRFGVGQVLFGG